jgi:hypothetical protein
MIPLFRRPMTKTLHFHFSHFSRDSFSESIDFTALKAALESNQGLEELSIMDVLESYTPDGLRLLFDGIAAAPNLRTLRLQYRSAYVTPRQIGKMFAQALKDCKNSSLEAVDIFCEYGETVGGRIFGSAKSSTSFSSIASGVCSKRVRAAVLLASILWKNSCLQTKRTIAISCIGWCAIMLGIYEAGGLGQL